MPTHVRLRFNKLTGEVEELLVDDLDRTLPEAEHERRALDIGRRLDVGAELVEVARAAAARTPTPEAEPGVVRPAIAEVEDG
jgi:hypothetical protein